MIEPLIEESYLGSFNLEPQEFKLVTGFLGILGSTSSNP